MAIMATIFLGYIFLGPYMPDMIAHKGASFSKGMTHQWLSTEGVFGVALGVLGATPASDWITHLGGPYLASRSAPVRIK